MNEERDLLERLERVLADGEMDQPLAPLVLIAGRSVPLEDGELRAARRRAMLLLAAGGDPRRELDLDGRAVTALAAELDSVARRAQLAAALRRLRDVATGLPLVEQALDRIDRDSPERAWRLFAAALLADELLAD